MSNETAISDALELLNISLSNLEAGITIVEYSAKNSMPISTLAKITIEESCEEIQNSARLLSQLLGE